MGPLILRMNVSFSALNSKVYLIRSETHASWDMNGIILEKELEHEFNFNKLTLVFYSKYLVQLCVTSVYESKAMEHTLHCREQSYMGREINRMTQWVFSHIELQWF